MRLRDLADEIEQRKERIAKYPEDVRDWDIETLQKMEADFERMFINKWDYLLEDIAREHACERAIIRQGQFRQWVEQQEETMTDEQREEIMITLSPLSLMQGLSIPPDAPNDYRNRAGQWAWEAAELHLSENFPRVYLMLKYHQDLTYPWMSMLERAALDLENRMDSYYGSMTESGMEPRAAYMTAWDEMVGELSEKDEYVDPDMDIERGDGERLPAWVMEALKQLNELA